MSKKYILIIILVAASFVAKAQTQGLGLRIGDPIGVTYKKFIARDRAVEFLLGTVPRSWHSNYYKNSFDAYSKYDDFVYRSHTVENTVYLQARYLIHNDIQGYDIEGKLQWYWGFGAMLKFGKVKYTYYDAAAPAPENNIRSDVNHNIDFGPDGIIGIEYTFEDIPLSAFAETSLMLELADRPVTPQLYGALGVRMNFSSWR